MPSGDGEEGDKGVEIVEDENGNKKMLFSLASKGEDEAESEVQVAQSGTGNTEKKRKKKKEGESIVEVQQ